MAAKKKISEATGNQKAQGLSDTQRWAYGLLLLAFALFLLASVVSYFIYWRADQSAAEWGPTFSAEGTKVFNWGGKTGAKIARLIAGEGLGVFSVCIPIVLIILALRIMRFRPLVLNKSVRLTLILMIIGSVTMGYIFGNSWALFDTGLGGRQGIEVALWLKSVLGMVGSGLLLLAAIIIYAVYVNRNTIFVVNRFGKGLVDGSKIVGGAVVDGGKKVGGAVVDKATGMLSGKDTEQDDEDESRGVKFPEKVEWNDKSQSTASGRDEDMVLHGDDQDTGTAPEDNGIFIDEDGFIVVDKSVHDAAGYPADAIRPSINDMYASHKKGEADDDDDMVLGGEGDADFGDDLDIEIAVAMGDDDEMLSDDMIDNTLYDPMLDLSSYKIPSVDLMEDHSVEVTVTDEEIRENKNRIEQTLINFGIKIDKIKATIGPTVTLYEIVPAPGVRISKIKNLEDDIALSLSALGIRIIAPIPGKGTIGIEVPNKDKKVVSMYSMVKSPKFQDSTFDIPVVLGKTIQNETFVIDLAKMPHLLVAGATGQGKSVGLNAIITSILYRKHPSELKFVLVDPKKVELTLYAKLEKHFLAKLPGEDEAIITDTHKVIYTLNSLCIEMDSRYDLLRKAEVRHIREYNDKFTHRKLNPEKGHRHLPYIVVVIDEFADLIMTAGREIETPIARLAQLARAVGIHLVIATQRPTTNIITGVIKANFPARIAFRVTSMIDSRTIIDQPGANQLIGRGDMLVSTGNELTRVQCAFIDTPEIERITGFIGDQRGYVSAYELPEYVPEGDANGVSKGGDLSQLDSMFEEVARFVVQNQQGSTSSIQRRFSIGYNRAGRLMDQLEMAGIVGRSEGSKPREVLISDTASLEMMLDNLL